MLKVLPARSPCGKLRGASSTQGLWLLCLYCLSWLAPTSFRTSRRTADTQTGWSFRPSSPLNPVARHQAEAQRPNHRARGSVRRNVHALSSFQRTKAPQIHSRIFRDSRPTCCVQRRFSASLSFRWRPSGEPFKLTTPLSALSTLFFVPPSIFIVADASAEDDESVGVPKSGKAEVARQPAFAG